MGNLCSQNTKGGTQFGAIESLTEIDLQIIKEKIKQHFQREPSSDFIHLSINKNLMKNALDITGSLISSRIGQESQPLINELIKEVGQITQKKFAPINLQNDPQQSQNIILVLANIQKISRFDYGRSLQLNEFCFKIKKQQLALGNQSLTEKQLLNVIRDYYEQDGMLVVGGYQDPKTPSLFNFLLVNFSLGKIDSSPKQNSPYFLTISYLQKNQNMIELLETFDSFIQAILCISVGEENYYYLVSKDPENVNINNTKIKVEEQELTGEQMKNSIVQINTELQNLFFMKDKVFYIVNVNEKREIKGSQVNEVENLSSEKQLYSQQQTQIIQNIKIEEKEKVSVKMQKEQLIQKKKKQLTYSEAEQPSSFFLEFFQTRGPYKLEEEDAQENDLICLQIDGFDKVKLSENSYFWEKSGLQEIQQEVIKGIAPIKISDFKSQLKMHLEYLGVQDHWKVYRILNKQSESLLYVSLAELVIPNCMREVHFYKEFVSSSNLYGQEYIIKQKEQISMYAVEVQLPYISLQGLLRIWLSETLSKRKEDYMNQNKLIYIFYQVVLKMRELHLLDIYHGSLDLQSIYLNINTYEVKIGNYSFIGKDQENRVKVKGKTTIGSEEEQNNLIFSSTQMDLVNLERIFQTICEQLQYFELEGFFKVSTLQTAIAKIENYFESNQEALKDLIEQFQYEDKEQDVYEKLGQMLLNKINHSVQIQNLLNNSNQIFENKEHMIQVQFNSQNYTTKFKLAKSFIEQLSIDQLIQVLKSGTGQNDNSLLFAFIQNIVQNGDIDLALDMLDYFSYKFEKLEETSDIFSFYLHIIRSDLELQQINFTSELYSNLPIKKQLILQVILGSFNDLEKMKYLEQTSTDLYNQMHPFHQLIIQLKQKEQIQLEQNFLPPYFVKRVNIRYQTRQSSNQGSQIKSQDTSIIQSFKILKNIVQLLLFHNGTIPLGQYENEETIYSFQRFIKDLFNGSIELHQKLEHLLRDTLEMVTSEENCTQIVESLMFTNMDEVRKSGQYKMNQFARMNFILNEFIFEFNKKGGKEFCKSSFLNQFNPEYYLVSRKYLLEDPQDFLEYIAMIVGIIETDTDKLRKYQSKYQK